jgi:hypothetical protein
MLAMLGAAASVAVAYTSVYALGVIKAGIDPKLVADQLGHGIGVNLDTYTIADLEQRLAAVNTLEQSLASTAIN